MTNFNRWSCLAVTMLAIFMAAGAAQAYMVGLTASAYCDEATGSIFIEYESTSWSTTVGQGENSQIDVSVDGVLVDSGAYAPPDFSFSGVTPAPSDASTGDILIVSAESVGAWGDGHPGGQSTSISVTVPADDCAPTTVDEGRFTGGGHQIRVDGVRVTRGLTIHCDLLLSNNLEINWQGNRFHMTEHLTTVVCSDDPDIIQAPPPAPLDTLVGTGTGRYNGTGGFSIEFTLVDGGEPGRMDQAAFLVYEEANPANVVLDVPLQFLTGGNLQAHYDQPHR